MSGERKAVRSIIQILADLPDFLRKPVLQKRLEEFYNSDQQSREETVKNALAVAPDVPSAKLATLVKTWLEVLAGFEPPRRDIMFRAYCSQLLVDASPLQRLDLDALVKAYLSLDEKSRIAISDSLHEVLLTFPEPVKILRVVPPDALAALGLSH